MANFSFDIVSEYDKAEMNNVFTQTERDIATRYDFKGTPASIVWLGDKIGLVISGNSEWQLEAILDIVRKKLASRNQSPKVIDTSKESTENNLKTTKEVPFISGLDQDKAKQITKLLRDELPKAKAQIQGESVRVMSSSKDILQQAMKLIKQHNFTFPIEFTNFR